MFRDYEVYEHYPGGGVRDRFVHGFQSDAMADFYCQTWTLENKEKYRYTRHAIKSYECCGK